MGEAKDRTNMEEGCYTLLHDSYAKTLPNLRPYPSSFKKKSLRRHGDEGCLRQQLSRPPSLMLKAHREVCPIQTEERGSRTEWEVDGVRDY